jgi:hypothetical protein
MKLIRQKVKIPRCSSCEAVHLKGRENYRRIFWISLILRAMSAITALWIIFGAPVGGVIGAVLGWPIEKAAERRKISRYGIRNLSKSTLTKHPFIARIAFDAFSHVSIRSAKNDVWLEDVLTRLSMLSINKILGQLPHS